MRDDFDFHPLNYNKLAEGNKNNTYKIFLDKIKTRKCNYPRERSKSNNNINETENNN